MKREHLAGRRGERQVVSGEQVPTKPVAQPRDRGLTQRSATDIETLEQRHREQDTDAVVGERVVRQIERVQREPCERANARDLVVRNGELAQLREVIERDVDESIAFEHEPANVPEVW